MGKLFVNIKLEIRGTRVTPAGFGWWKVMGKRPLRRQGVHVIMLKWILKKSLGTVYTALFQIKVVGSCEHVNEISRPVRWALLYSVKPITFKNHSIPWI